MELAVHVDSRRDVRAEVGFFGQGPRMFGSLHLPDRGAIRAGVLICSSIQSEFLANYRREARLAGVLAARGVAVARFHYRGTGHSDGEGRDVTFEGLQADAQEAAQWLRDRSGVDDLSFLGTRLGAIVAAGLAAETDGAPLALWEPVVDGGHYFDEIFRLRRMSSLSLGKTGSRKTPLDEMEEAGYADVFGFAIDQALYESSRGKNLATESGPAPRRVLLVQVDPEMHLRAEYEVLVDVWKRAAFCVDVRLFSGQEAWWFPGTQWQEADAHRSEMMVAETAEWLSEHMAAIPR